MLTVEQVTKEYTLSEDAPAAQVLRGIDLTVQDGERIAIVGPSGCGKSTLLNIIGTLDKPTAGRVLLDGEDVTQLSEKQQARLRNERLGFIFQLHHLLPQLTVLENVLAPTLAHSGAGNGARDRAAALLEQVGLADFMDHRPAQLSGGQQQRVAVVRALINEPKVLLADEPTGSLDRKAAENIAELLVELNETRNLTLIVVTHAMGLAGKMQTIYELADGTLHRSGETPPTQT